MEHWRKKFFERDDKFIGSWDLFNEQTGKFESKVVTITRFGEAEIAGDQGKELRPVIYLKEFKKPMVMNKTNFKNLSKRFGTNDPNDYVGKQVLLTVQSGKAFGEIKDMLRFSFREIPAHMLESNKPVKEGKQALTDVELKKQIDLIKQGKSDPSRVQNVRSVNKKQLDELNKAHDEYQKSQK